jgi:very-short-patch-repair endonuclease
VKVDRTTLRHARDMRQSLTNAEAIMWSRLQKKRLSGYKFRRQHPVGPYIADFACREAMLIVELDGETHSSESERRHDARRTAFLEAQGWSVVRFWNFEIYDNLHGVLWVIEDAVRAGCGGR